MAGYLTLVPLTIFIFISISITATGAFTDPDLTSNAIEFISSRQFKPESHSVITDDGYILTLHRIVNKKFRLKSEAPILLMHPLCGSSVDFMYNSPGGSASESMKSVGNNLAFELAKRGYDVWLGNVRGNIYSSMTLLPTDKFWDFSFDEFIAHDLPAILKYILLHTKKSKINYIGFSQGTLMMFGLLSQKPEVSGSINKFVALGPVAFLRNVAPSVKKLLKVTLFKKYISECEGFISNRKLIHKMSETFCSHRSTRKLCEKVIFLMSGFDHNQLNSTRLPVYINHIPAGTSCKNIRHYIQQIFHADTLTMYDYGFGGNIRKYGQINPPQYNLGRITLNKSISLIYGQSDFLSVLGDIDRLKGQLNVQLADDYLIPDHLWNHLDFIWGKDAGKFVNRKVIEIIERH